MLDLRIPTGAFFALIGIILLGMAAFAPDARAALSDANVDLYCGAVMLLFGVFMLWMARRAARRS